MVLHLFDVDIVFKGNFIIGFILINNLYQEGFVGKVGWRIVTVKNNMFGFPRIKLKDIANLTNNLNAAPKITELSIDDIKDFWNKIRIISREQGCVEGVRFEYNRE